MALTYICWVKHLATLLNTTSYEIPLFTAPSFWGYWLTNYSHLSNSNLISASSTQLLCTSAHLLLHTPKSAPVPKREGNHKGHFTFPLCLRITDLCCCPLLESSHLLCFATFILIYGTKLSLTSGEGDGTPLRYSCLENPMGGGAW